MIQISVPKLHHYVPGIYMKAWAGTNGQVVVRRRRSSEAFKVPPQKVGAQKWLYGKGDDAVRREDLFSKLEGDWPRLRQELIRRRCLISTEDRRAISTYAAFQIVRTREHVLRDSFAAELSQFANGQEITRDLVRKFLCLQNAGIEPSEGEIEGAWSFATYSIETLGIDTDEMNFGIRMDVALQQLAPRLQDRNWVLEACKSPSLWTSDRPVMPWRQPTPSDNFEGLGYEEAQEVRLPLSPTHILIMHQKWIRPQIIEAAPRRFKELNAETAAQCFEFVLGAPWQKLSLDRLKLADHRPAIKFNQAPGVRRLPDGTQEPMGDIIHMYTPIRAVPPGYA